MHVFALIFVLLASPALAQTVAAEAAAVGDVAEKPVSAPTDPLCSSGKWGEVQCIAKASFAPDVCATLEAQALRHGLAPGFFARLIWQESRFDPNALSSANAMGIAQFIASTAKLRGLEDPYNPALALEHSAQYLGELSKRYGSHGLAAVAYNGGERRADGIVAGTGGLAEETVNYVRIITGLNWETWVNEPPKDHDFRLSKDKPFRAACLELAANRRLTPLKPPPGQTKPWGVQLAFGGTLSAAKRAYARKTAQCPVTRKEKVDYIRVKNRVSGRKGYYMARIGRDTRDSADRYCRALSRSGCLCRVYKN